MSLKEQIVDARDTNLTPLEVPEWGCTVHLKELCYGERLKLVEAMKPENKGRNLLYPNCVVHCVFDQGGNRVFGDDDYDVVLSKNPGVVVRVGEAAAKLNKLVGDVIQDAKNA